MNIINIESTLKEFDDKLDIIKLGIAGRIKDKFEHTIKFYWQEAGATRKGRTVDQRESAASGKKGTSYYHNNPGNVGSTDVGLRWTDTLLNSMLIEIDSDEVTGTVTDPKADLKESGLTKSGNKSFWDIFIKLFEEGLERFTKELVK